MKGEFLKMGEETTFGTYEISQIFDVEAQRILTRELSPIGKSFFRDPLRSFILKK